MKMNLKSIFFVAKNEYVTWLCNPKIFLFAAIFVPIREIVIVPLLNAAEKMQQPLGIFESYIATANTGVGVLLFALCYIILMSSFPTVDGNTLFYIARMGKKLWAAGEIVFQCLCAATYSTIIMAASLLQTVNVSYVSNGWSLVVTDYDRLYGEPGVFTMARLIPQNLYCQMAPYKAFFISFGMLTLFFTLCGLTFVIGCIYSRRLLFFFIQIAHISLGCGLMMIQTQIMWLFPVSHAFLKIHYYKYFRKWAFPPGVSLIVLACACIISAAVIYRKAKTVSIDMIGGDVLP